jgi:hypothetical protein
MQKRFSLSFIALVVLAVFGSIALATQEAKKPAEKITKDMCLGCHGPYEKIIKATENFKTPNGDASTPHRYVPHDSKDIPECTECHVPHGLTPLPEKSTVEKPKDVQFCYDGCHHMRNLQSCKNCH